MLHFEMRMPDGVTDGAPVLVLLHGRGADERDLLDLGEALAPDAMVISPRAPFPGAPWGYGPGWAWYRYLGGNTPDPESFARSQTALEELLEGLADRLPVRPGPILLGGFSQGGTMSVAYALRRPGSVAGVLNFSGFLADHPEVETGLGDARGVRAFWGHGTGDPNIPFAMGVEGRGRLREAGVDLEERDYQIGHWIAPEEVSDAAVWIRGVLAAEHEGARGDGNTKRVV
jgi:phospholipase/carboxylesterase